MDREELDKAGPDRDKKAAQSNTRFTSPLVINSASRRRSLFSRPRAKEDAPGPTSSGSISDANVASPNNTRIPRPAQRLPFTLSDAYRLAEEEEAAQGSPSPAPRSWRSRRPSAEKRTAKTGSPNTSDTPRRGAFGRTSLAPKRGDSNNERPASSHQSDLSDSTFDEKLRQYALDHTSPEDPGRRNNGLFSKSRLGTRIVETGRELLVRKSSRGSLENSPVARTAKATTNSPSLLRRLSGRKRESSDASSSARPSSDWAQPDADAHNESPRPSTSPRAGPDTALQNSHTPSRSFAWQADADFTAGDLQVSNSPPVALARSNTRIDEIRALEAEVNGRLSESPSEYQPGDTRTDDIRAPESKPALKVTGESQESDQATGDTPETRSEGEDKVPNLRPVSRASMRMDELRSREIERLSRKALATARLDEFRERKIGTSRSPSPDIARKPNGESIRAFSPLRDRLRRQENEAPATTAQAEGGQSDPSTLAPALPVHKEPASSTANADRGSGKKDDQADHRSGPQTKDEPSDLLRRLAAATGSSPAPEPRVIADNQAPPARDRGPTERARSRMSFGGAKRDVRPTVGFAGLSRSSSVESRTSKRKSFAQSDSDPIERIEGEMQLFAPQENQSERGSLRVPSPEPEDKVPNETPKPTKVDPLTQPTPKVTGAFVETPATVKVEKFEGLITGPTSENNKNVESQRNVPRRLSTDSSGDSGPSITQGERGGNTARQPRRSQSSRGDRLPGRSSSLSGRRRVKSLSRGRTLTNSARLPTVKGDMLDIHRANQIDDSTLDDIADLLNQQDQLGAASSSGGVKHESGNTGKFDREQELEAYERMSRSLETGLLGIRSAKQGIERLEGKVAHADAKEHEQHQAHGSDVKGGSPSCRLCDGAQKQRPADAAVTYVHLPLPLLWHRKPKFRFTLLGLSLFLLSLWYTAESCMCFRYCKPNYCYPGTPCDWSADDPVWGHAIPVKLDQWVAGGRGRDLVRQLRPEVVDWLADMWDAATGTDLTEVDTSRFSWEQKRQYRRRLARKGLSEPFVERPEDQDVFSGWRSVREADERAQTAQDMGYEYGEDQDEGIGGN